MNNQNGQYRRALLHEMGPDFIRIASLSLPILIKEGEEVDDNEDLKELGEKLRAAAHKKLVEPLDYNQSSRAVLTAALNNTWWEDIAREYVQVAEDTEYNNGINKLEVAVEKMLLAGTKPEDIMSATTGAIRRCKARE